MQYISYISYYKLKTIRIIYQLFDLDYEVWEMDI